ncbi:MAG: MATE family efflux transporter [Bacillota bacterium]
MVTVKKEKTVFFMSLPIFVELFMQFLVGNIDQIMLAGISEDAVASIVNANQLITLVMVVATFLANAVMVRFTHAIGRKNGEMYEKAFFSGHVMMGIYSIFAMIIFMAFGSELLILFNASESIIGDASMYLIVVSFAMIPYGIYCINTAALRSKGLLNDVMLISIFMNILNIVGNAILINGWFGAPALGVLGAGISTAFSKIVGSILVFVRLYKADFVKFDWKFFKQFPKNTTKRLLHLAIPASVESSSYSLSQMVILSFINIFGTTVVATKGYCSIIANFAFLYSIAMAQATQIVVGYMIGRNEFDPIKKRVMKSNFVCIICSMTVMTIMYFASDTVFNLFSASEEVKQLGKTILLIEIFLEFGRSVNIIMSRMLTSVGDTYFLMGMGCFGHWMIGVLLAYIFGVHFGFGLVGIWIAMAIDENIRGIAYLVRFSIKKWDRESILKIKNNRLYN